MLAQPRPCPFCGSERIVVERHILVEWQVECCNCNASGPRVKYTKQDEHSPVYDKFHKHNKAVELWNNYDAACIRRE